MAGRLGACIGPFSSISCRRPALRWRPRDADSYTRGHRDRVSLGRSEYRDGAVTDVIDQPEPAVESGPEHGAEPNEPVADEYGTEPIADEYGTEPIADWHGTEPISDWYGTEPIVRPVHDGRIAEPFTESKQHGIAVRGLWCHEHIDLKRRTNRHHHVEGVRAMSIDPRTWARASAAMAVVVVMLVGAGTAAGLTGDSAGGGIQSNVVVVVNTKDNSVATKAGMLVAHDATDTVANGNAAAASASCTDCRTVAVAVQVVLVQRNANVVTPSNIAIALNNQCTRCETMAAAYQDVISTDGIVHFTPEGEREINAINHRIEEAIDSPASLFDIKARLDEEANQLWQVVDAELVHAGVPFTSTPRRHVDIEVSGETADPSPSPTPSESTSPSPTTSATPCPTDSPSPGPTVSASPSPAPIESPAAPCPSDPGPSSSGSTAPSVSPSDGSGDTPSPTGTVGSDPTATIPPETPPSSPSPSDVTVAPSPTESPSTTSAPDSPSPAG